MKLDDEPESAEEPLEMYKPDRQDFENKMSLEKEELKFAEEPLPKFFMAKQDKQDPVYKISNENEQ